MFGLAPTRVCLHWGGQNARCVQGRITLLSLLDTLCLTEQSLVPFCAARAPFSSLLLLPMQTLKMYRNSCKLARVVSQCLFHLHKPGILEEGEIHLLNHLLQKRTTSQLTRSIFLRCSCLFSTAVRNFLWKGLWMQCCRDYKLSLPSKPTSVPCARLSPGSSPQYHLVGNADMTVPIPKALWRHCHFFPISVGKVLENPLGITVLPCGIAWGELTLPGAESSQTAPTVKLPTWNIS